MQILTLSSTSFSSNWRHSNFSMRSFSWISRGVPKYLSHNLSGSELVFLIGLPHFNPVTNAKAFLSNRTPTPLKLNSATLGSSHSICHINKLCTTTLENLMVWMSRKWPKHVFANSWTPVWPSFRWISSIALDKLKIFVTLAPKLCLSSGMMNFQYVRACACRNKPTKT